ncbi:MAG: pentapeptide repeat-containing protein [Alphaproteobacteria bacterium]
MVDGISAYRSASTLAASYSVRQAGGGLSAEPTVLGQSQGRTVDDVVSISARARDAFSVQKGYEERGAFGQSVANANLHGVTLISQSLVGADFRGADLTDSNFTGSDLTGVNFVGADLRNARLINVDLTNADLRGADLRGANLAGATGLSRSQLTYANVGATTVLPSALRGTA